MAFTPCCGTGRLKVIMFIELAIINQQTFTIQWSAEIQCRRLMPDHNHALTVWQNFTACLCCHPRPSKIWATLRSSWSTFSNKWVDEKSHNKRQDCPWQALDSVQIWAFDLAATIEKTVQVVICGDSGLHWSKTWPKKTVISVDLLMKGLPRSTGSQLTSVLVEVGRCNACNMYIYICNVCKATSPKWNLASPRRYPGKHCILEGGSNFGVLLSNISDTELFEFSH